MRYLLILLVLFGCQSSSTTNEIRDDKIFMEFLISTYEAWSQATGRSTIPTFSWKEGDSIKTTMELGILVIPNDTIEEIPLDNIITLDSGELLVINRTLENKVEISTVFNDSIYKGFVTKEQLLINKYSEDFINSSRKHLLSDFHKRRKEGISKILTKYSLTEEELNKIIATQYQKNSGKNYHYQY